jgi:hypothetical protein
MSRRTTNDAIEANLAVLADGLAYAAVLARSAQAAMHAGLGNRNLAIGTILPLEQDLPVFVGLLTAILALHRQAGQGGEP